MDKKTRQIYENFIEEVSSLNADSVDDKRLQALISSIKPLLVDADTYDIAVQRIKSARRYVESKESGAAKYELISLISELQKRLDQNSTG